MENKINLRPINFEDESFLYKVYASTRQGEMSLVDWDERQKKAFLKMQFAAQHKYYQEHYTKAEFNLILLDQTPIGRLYIHRRKDEIRLVDITLLPAYCNQGIGSALLKDILAEGERSGLPVRVHVERSNPALRLYTRLGFRQIVDKGVYFFLEWSPESLTRSSEHAG